MRRLYLGRTEMLWAERPRLSELSVGDTSSSSKATSWWSRILVESPSLGELLETLWSSLLMDYSNGVCSYLTFTPLSSQLCGQDGELMPEVPLSCNLPSGATAALLPIRR